MALPNPVTPRELRRPRPRVTLAVVTHSGPTAVVMGTFLGGHASGDRIVYNDAHHYVWWRGPPTTGAYGAGAYGAGPYGETEESP